jgi:Family of unknown function (DUF6252)
MKKILLLLVSVFLLNSCQDELKSNNPAFQAQKQGVLWRATSYEAKLTSEGYVIITAVNGLETVTMRTFKILPHTSNFGLDVENFAELNNRSIASQANYSTGFNGGSGQITINEYSGGTLSGTFNFKAVNTDTSLEKSDVVSFRSGFFYKIPVTVIP